MSSGRGNGLEHIVLLSRSQNYATPDGQQIMPFFMYRQQLLDSGISFTNIPTQTPQDRTNAIRESLASSQPPDIVIVMPHWSEDADELARWFDQSRSLISPAKIVMLDYYAPTCSPHFGVLPYVDQYIKRQVLRDRDLYQQDYQGGFIYADFIARHWGFDLKDWFFGSKPDPAHIHKLVAGWNLGITPRYQKMLRLSSLSPLPWRLRPIDVHLRVGTTNRTDKPQEWYQFSRGKALEQAGQLPSTLAMSGSGRVGPKRYFAELFASKIVVSPFGWGEVCFRDYEAVCAGAVLVKPDMSHLETHPDIYLNQETYAPLAWDYSDVHQRVMALLENPAECKRLRTNAARALREAYKGTSFVGLIKQLCAATPGPAGSHGPVATPPEPRA